MQPQAGATGADTASAETAAEGSRDQANGLRDDAKGWRDGAESLDPDAGALPDGGQAMVAGIAAVPAILTTVRRLTGLGFAALTRVSDERWLVLAAEDGDGFDLRPGDSLPRSETLCDIVALTRAGVAIADLATAPDYALHAVLTARGIRAYVAVPVILADGTPFGTLCAFGRQAASFDADLVLSTLTLFADLIGHHIDSAFGLGEATQRLAAARGELAIVNDTLREASQSLAAATSDLNDARRTAELRELFIAVLGHDLRNPIAALDGGVSLLLRDGFTERTPLLLQLMKTSVLRMSALVSNVMDLTRARLGGGIGVHIAGPVDIAGVILHVVDELRAAHPDAVIETYFDLPRRVPVDPQRIGQMLSNLLANALTHGDGGKPIRVDASVDGVFELSVSNSGPPIPPDAEAVLFRAFHRGQVQSNGEGLGLGLYIASQIAIAHGGTLGVRSTPQETRFTFRMPLLGGD